MELPLISMTIEGQIVEKNMILNLRKTYMLNGIYSNVRNHGLYNLVCLPKQRDG